MADLKISFEDFLMEVPPESQAFTSELHNYFLSNGCIEKYQLAKNGIVVSYTFIKSKRVIANFVFRKSGLIIRIYADFIPSYADFLNSLPQPMLKSIDKAPVCKRLIDPEKCSSRCKMGYSFTLLDNDYKKCRFNCFMFNINTENNPFIKDFISNEINARDLHSA